jgi:hypothetical protein
MLEGPSELEDGGTMPDTGASGGDAQARADAPADDAAGVSDGANGGPDGGPPLISVLAHCTSQGNELYVSGTSGEFIFEGTLDIHDGQWLVGVNAPDAGATSQVEVTVQTSVTEGSSWNLVFSRAFDNELLATGTYEAESPPQPGVLWFHISGNGRGCDRSTATVLMSSIAISSSGSLTDFAAAFTQRCIQGDDGVLSGCVHVRQ